VVSDSSFTDLSNITLSAPSAGTISGTNWNIASLAHGATDTLTVSGTIMNAGAFSNTATVSTPTYDPTPPSPSTAGGTAVAAADLNILKTLQTTGTIYDGEHVTFQVKVGNTGPDAAQNVVVSDSAFSDLSNITLSAPSDGTISGTNWDIASLANGATDTITVSGIVTSAGAFSNTATATTTTYDTSTNLSSTATGTAVAAADLVVDKILQTSGTIYDGQNVSFELQIQNTGPDAAQNVVLSDSTFSGLSNITFAEPPTGTSVSGSNWNIGTLASGATDTILVSAIANTVGTFSNTATATTTTYDLNSSPTSTANGTAVLSGIAYTVVQEPGPSPYSQGDDAIYQINLSTGAYTGIVANSFNSDVGVGNIETNNHLWAIAVDPSNGYIYGVNAAGLLQINPSDPQATHSYLSTSTSIANLGVNSAVTFSPQGVGAETLYAVSVSNSSPLYTISYGAGSAATATALGSAIGQSLTGIAENSAGHLYGIGNNGADIYQLNTSTGAILATLPITYPSGVSSGSITGLTFDAAGNLWALGKGDIFSLTPNANDTAYNAAVSTTYNTQNSGSGFESLTFAPVASSSPTALQLSETVSTPNLVETTTSSANETFTVTLTNPSAITGTNISISDVLPTGIHFVSDSTSAGTYNSSSGVWSLPSLASGASATLTLTGNVTEVGSLTNIASVNAVDQSSLNDSYNAATATVHSSSLAYTIVETPGSDPYENGHDAIYQINLATGSYTGIVPNSLNSDVGVGNSGSQNDYINAIASDPMNGNIYAINATGLLQINPADPQATMTYLSTNSSITAIGLNSALAFSPVGVGSGETLYAINTGGSSHLYTINIGAGTATAVGTGTGQTLTAIAENSAGHLYGVGNNGADIYQISTSTGSVLATLPITYLSGPGGNPIVGLSFSDNGALWATDQKGDIYNISLTPDSNGHYDATLASNYNTTLAGSGFENLTIASGSYTQQNSLSITQSDSAPTVFSPDTSGSNETYTVTVTNTSGVTGTNVTVSDLLPNGMSFVSDTTSSGSYNSSTGLWNIASLASGSSATLTVTGDVTALGTFTNTATLTYEDQYNSNAANNVTSTVVTAAEPSFTGMISDANNSGSAVMVEAALVNHATPWDSIFAPVVLPTDGGQTYFSIPTTFNITAGQEYSLAAELAHGSTGQNIQINGFLPLFTDTITPNSLSGETDSRYGSTSDWHGGQGNQQLTSGSAEAFTTVITPGASSQSPGTEVQQVTHAIDSNTPTDTSSNVSFLYGNATNTSNLTVTGGNSGDFLDAASDSTHHYAIFGGTGSNVIVYNSEDASIFGGAQGSAPSWNTLVLYGNDNISLNTTNNVTTATTAGGISGGTQVSSLDILNISGYNVDSNGHPIINTNGTVSAGTNTVTLHADDVLNMSTDTLANLTAADPAFNQIAGQPGVNASDPVLLINGNSNSTVNLAEGNWASAGTVTDSHGAHYAAFTHAGVTHSGEALVLINTSITHVTGHA